MKALIAIAAASLFALAACGGSPTAAGASGGTVNATLADTMKITLDRTSVPAGVVTFNVKNAGATAHEIVVLKTDTAADKIEPDPDEAGKVSEEDSKGESGDLEAGTNKTFTLTLEPGKYVLICNEVGHYAAGMRIPFTVTK
jgi:uncharacterized cupredoxin-like copper-binding protein